MELRVLQAEWLEAQRRNFYARYFTGIVLPELLDSPILDRLETAPTEVCVTEEVDWWYYLEVILPALLESYDCGEITEDPLELSEPVVTDWNLEEHALVSGISDVDSSRFKGTWIEDALDQNPDFFESWSP